MATKTTPHSSGDDITALAKATEQLGTTTRKMQRTAANTNTGTTATENEAIDLKEKIKENPLYKIVVADKASTTEEKIEAIVKFTTFDKENDPENSKKVAAIRELLDYLQAQQKATAIGQIKSVADESSAAYQTALNKVVSDLKDYNQVLEPLQRAFESLSGQRAPEKLREFVEQQQKRIGDYEKQQADLRDQIDESQTEVHRAERREAERRTGVSGFFLKMRETISDTQETRDTRAKLATLQEQIRTLEKTKPTEEEQEQLKNAQEALRILNMAKGDSFQKKVSEAAQKALSLIDNINVTIDGAAAGLTEVGKQIRQLHRANDQITVALTVLREGLTRGLSANNEGVNALTQAMQAPEIANDPVEKKKAEIRQMNATRYVGSVNSVHNEAATGAAQSEQQKAILTDVDRSNAEAVEGARLVKTQGIATTADRLAALLTSISSQGNAETSRVANALLQELRNAATRTLTQNMERTPQIYKDRNDEIKRMTDGITKIRDVMNETSEVIVSELRKRQTHIKDAGNAAESLRGETIRRTGLENEALIKGAAPVDSEGGTDIPKVAVPVAARPAAKGPTQSEETFEL